MEHTRWFLAVVALCVFAGSVSASPMVSVEPEHIEVSQGDVFAVNITIDQDGTEIMGAQYDLHFNNTLLNAVDQSKGPFLSQDGVSTNVYANKINNTLGKIEYSETRTGVEHGVTDPGVLTTIEFEVRCPGTDELHLDKVRLSYPNATYISDVSVSSGTCDIKGMPTPTPTEQTPKVYTTPAQSVETSAVNQTPLPSPTAPIMSTAVQTPTADQISSEPASPATAGTARTPARNNMVPGFEASIAIVGLLTIIISKGRRM